MDYEDPGTPKPGAAVLANMITPEGRKLPLLITENFGRGRTAIMATGGSWRWQMELAPLATPLTICSGSSSCAGWFPILRATFRLPSPLRCYSTTAR